MIKNASCFAFLLFIVSSINIVIAQDAEGCDGARYRYLVFDDFQKIEDVVYGSNISANGNEVELDMDIYLPQGDSITNRPVILIAHGGFFITGNNEFADVVTLCEDFAKMGYVVCSYSYRLGVDDWFNLQESFQEAVLRGVHDGKAATRFLRKTHAEDGNPWGIDPTRIILGGSSAGAFIALHNAYLELDEILDLIDLEQLGLGGGIEGLSGNMGYSSEVLSVFSMSGAIGTTAWMEVGDVPVVSTHGTSDSTVPYGSGTIEFLFLSVDDVDGSQVVHEVADSLGIENCFYTMDDAEHIPHSFSEAYHDTTLSVISGFNSRMVCPTYEPICGVYDVTDVPEIIEEPPIECLEDLVPNGIIDLNDMLLFFSNYGCVGDCIGDFNGTGNVSISDFLAILTLYGSYCE